MMIDQAAMTWVGGLRSIMPKIISKIPETKTTVLCDGIYGGMIFL